MSEKLFKEILKKAEQFFDIENVYPKMLSISILPTTEDTFQSALIYSEDISLNQGKFLDLPSWANNSEWKSAYHDELYGEGVSLEDSLNDLNNQLDALINSSKKEWWIIKNSYGNYYNNIIDPKLPWHTLQKNARRFLSKSDAHQAHEIHIKSDNRLFSKNIKILKLKVSSYPNLNYR